MDLILPDNAKDFLDLNQSFLEEREAANNLMLGLAMSLAKNTYRTEQTPFYLAVTENGVPVFCSLQTPPYNFIVNGKEGSLERAARLAFEHLLSSDHKIPGFIGAKDQVRKCVDIWADLSGQRAKLSMSQRVFRLDKLNDIRISPGKLRLATEEDLPVIVPWIQAFSFEAVKQELSEDKARESANHQMAHQNLYVWDDNGPVSIANISRPTRHGITVSLVYTPHELRGRGYASNSVANLSRLMLERDFRFCTLFTDLSNPTSNKIYQHMGYKPVVDFEMWVIMD